MGVFTGNPIITITLLCWLMADARRNIRTNVCKWCDSSQPVCDGGICLTNCSLSSYCEDPEEICVSIWKQDNYSVKVSSLCHHPQLLVESIQVTSFNSSMCLMKAVPSETFQLYVCGCIHEPECNDKLIFHNQTNGLNANLPVRECTLITLPRLSEYSILQSREVIPIAAISLLPPVLVAITITVVFYLYRTQRFILRSKDWLKKTNHNTEMVLETSRCDDYNYKLSSVMITDPHPNMSSACANTINHNTELLPIELDQRVGKGRFAEVWRAKLKHATSGQYEVVAVKIFPCQEYSSWVNESQIYADDNLKHDNVLQFITAEDRGSNMQKEYWIITAYQFRGNLKDYLSNHMLSWTTFLKMAGSVVSGVAHLHSDFTPYGIPKIPIAHRDIKSTNILVKNNYECVLCDFGIALRLDPSLTADDFANSGQVGTARYMAPEVLESRVNLEDLESFKQMDVYSLALVLWELGSRCEASGEVRSYELPFGSMVREQPCVETMRNVVLHGRGRPDIPQGWIRHPGLEILSDTITDCWDHDPEARLTAHCVAERINLMSQLDWANNNIRTVD